MLTIIIQLSLQPKRCEVQAYLAYCVMGIAWVLGKVEVILCLRAKCFGRFGMTSRSIIYYWLMWRRFFTSFRMARMWIPVPRSESRASFTGMPPATRPFDFAQGRLYAGTGREIRGQALGRRPFGKLRAVVPTTAKQKPLIKSTPSTSSRQALRQAQGRGLLMN